MQKITVK